MIHNKKRTMRTAFAALVAAATLLGGTGFTMTATAAEPSKDAASQSQSAPANDTTPTGSSKAGEDIIPTFKQLEELRKKAEDAYQKNREAQKALSDAKARLDAAQKALDKAKKDQANDEKAKQILKEVEDALKTFEENTTQANEQKVLDAAKKVADQLKGLIDFTTTNIDTIAQSLEDLDKRLASYAQTIKDLTAAVDRAKKNVTDLANKVQKTMQAWTAALNALSDAFEKWYPAHQYSDVTSTDWFYPAVTEATKRGLMTGYGNGKFGPYDAVTREQAALILYRHAGSPVVVGTLPYKDSGKVSGWARDAVIWARQNGIMGGYGARNVFGPQDTLTREQAAAIINRDAGNTKASPASAMRWAVDHKVIKGWPDRRGLDPKGRVDRAQMAQILVNAINNKVL